MPPMISGFQAGAPRMTPSPLWVGLFDHQMGFVIACRDDLEAQNFRYHLSRIAGAIHAMVGLLVRRQSRRIQRAKTGFVAEQRPAGHGHATRQQDLDGGIEPNHPNAGGAKEFRGPGLRIGSAAESQYDRFLYFEGAAERGA